MTQIEKIADEVLQLLIEEDPLGEMIQGLPGVDSRLSDLGEAAQAALRTRALDAARRAKACEEGVDGDWVTRAVVIDQAEAIAARVQSRLVETEVADMMVSPIARLHGMLPMVRPKDEEAERNYFTRLAAIPEYLATAAERHRGGIAGGRPPVGSRVAYALTHLENYLANPADDPLRQVPVTNTTERDRLLDVLVRPAFDRYRVALAEDVAPHGRPDDKPGLCWLPGGELTYASLARVHTTTDRTPEDLHQTGLALIEALAEEYLEIGGRVFGVKTVAEVHHKLRTDPALKWNSAEELLAGARAAMDRAEAAAPDWFGLMPSHACLLERTAASVEQNEASAYYHPPALDGSKPGVYFANTYRATERDRYVAEATAFHEAVPGHHFQCTIAQELSLPTLRRCAAINAYAEGWGLYCERLADEMGLYSDDVARLGMLAQDSVRAARLVVDTGLHALGWSRQQTVDYLRENTVMSDVEIQSETDRYIGMPGQALSYMVGRLEIQRLRARAQGELGSAFDIKGFHDLVLGAGPVPMATLDRIVAEWTEAAK
ncbi:DUF885 domain-containing protein [Kibdelosporangium phytohabitans]|uniref:DUF885 domain-containing protein n=1 Tax=Kibdelosporangium phytohabitans TaxID=860235 RepID=A0A0N9HZ63_9PSEU|nr:DUF885 domain-containing protein [Kibdelosporangium phytohabitans]ALG07517.1 hypothetical protein AOZ06_11860 [Kibdelosporangium phytohabitans]MBE1471563.1 uncharacterized protein (DUF885 family) [Kibdelosporangium phytohabitans]